MGLTAMIGMTPHIILAMVASPDQSLWQTHNCTRLGSQAAVASPISFGLSSWIK
jgi:hypothetical protein